MTDWTHPHEHKPGPMVHVGDGWVRGDQIDAVTCGEHHRGVNRVPPRALTLTIRLRSGHTRSESWNTTYQGTGGPLPDEWGQREARLAELLEHIAAACGGTS